MPCADIAIKSKKVYMSRKLNHLNFLFNIIVKKICVSTCHYVQLSTLTFKLIYNRQFGLYSSYVINKKIYSVHLAIHCLIEFAHNRSVARLTQNK